MSAKGLTTGQAIGKLHGPVNLQVQLKISRKGQIDPIDITVTRAAIYTPAVELQVRLDAGKLMIEATGPWPVLDFEKGKPWREGLDSFIEKRRPDYDRFRRRSDGLGHIPNPSFSTVPGGSSR